VNGRYAELSGVPAVNALPLPQGLDCVGAASLPIVLTTVWHMLVQLAQLQLSEMVLVWGAVSSVGSMAIQVAKLLGARVLATAGSDEKLKRAITLGRTPLSITTLRIFREKFAGSQDDKGSTWSSSMWVMPCGSAAYGHCDEMDGS
jgi:NADPH:quinone reductase-like Zn-dependent oxidoreductase